MEKLRRFGFVQIDAAIGHLACGDDGMGKMPEPAELFQHIERALAGKQDMAGLKVLVTAGPTQESLDPVRFLTNHSSGKMGYAVAKAAMLRGAEVTLVSGPTALEKPPFVEVVPVTSAADMFDAVSARAAEQDIIVKAAAVADYTPLTTADQKLKKAEIGRASCRERV